MKHLTIRHDDPELDCALRRERARRGATLNQTVIELLRQALGLSTDRPYSNGLADLAGTWDDEEFRLFEKNTARFGKIDDEIWK